MANGKPGEGLFSCQRTLPKRSPFLWERIRHPTTLGTRLGGLFWIRPLRTTREEGGGRPCSLTLGSGSRFNLSCRAICRRSGDTYSGESLDLEWNARKSSCRKNSLSARLDTYWRIPHYLLEWNAVDFRRAHPVKLKNQHIF